MKELKEFYRQALEKWAVVLDKAVLAFGDQLDYRPSEKSYSAREMSIHAYQMVHMYSYAVKHGAFLEQNFHELGDFDAMKTGKDIVDYGRRVKDFALGVIDELEDLEHEVSYGGFEKIGVSGGHVWPDWSMGARESMDKIVEDIVHHRAQLFTYLRLLGLQPPFIYDYRAIE